MEGLIIDCDALDCEDCGFCKQGEEQETVTRLTKRERFRKEWFEYVEGWDE